MKKEHFVTDGQTKIVTPWAPVGAKKIYLNGEACLLMLLFQMRKKILLSCCLAIKVYKTNYCLVPGLHPLKAAFQELGSPLSTWLSCFSEHGMCFRHKVLDLFNLLVPDFKFKLIFQVLQLERNHLEQLMLQLHHFVICKNI